MISIFHKLCAIIIIANYFLSLNFILIESPAWNARDLESAVSCFTEDCEYDDSQFDEPNQYYYDELDQ